MLEFGKERVGFFIFVQLRLEQLNLESFDVWKFEFFFVFRLTFVFEETELFHSRELRSLISFVTEISTTLGWKCTAERWLQVHATRATRLGGDSTRRNKFYSSLRVESPSPRLHPSSQSRREIKFHPQSRKFATKSIVSVECSWRLSGKILKKAYAESITKRKTSKQRDR